MFVVEALRALPDEKLAATSLAVALAFPPGNGTRQYADELEADFRQRLDKEPTDSATRLGLALILARTGRAEEAVKVLETYGPRPENKGDRLLIEQIDLLGMVAQQVDRPEMWKSLRPLFAASLIRYPLDPRAALAVGEAEAALGNVEAARRELERAINLAGCRNIRFTSTDRERIITSAQKALARINGN
jgi:thioredoxin-like negative regulator of GroEL